MHDALSLIPSATKLMGIKEAKALIWLMVPKVLVQDWVHALLWGAWFGKLGNRAKPLISVLRW